MCSRRSRTWRTGARSSRARTTSHCSEPVAPPAHVESRDRGAVLPRVATRRLRVVRGRGRRGRRPTSVGRVRRGSCPVRSCGRSSCTDGGVRPRLLRNRHSHCVDCDRRRAGGRTRADRDWCYPPRPGRALEITAGAGMLVLALAWTRLSGTSPLLLPRRSCGLRGRDGDRDRGRGASGAGPGTPPAVVVLAVPPRAHQLRRVPVALAVLRPARLGAGACQRSPAVRGPGRGHTRNLDRLVPVDRTAHPARRAETPPSRSLPFRPRRRPWSSPSS